MLGEQSNESFRCRKILREIHVVQQILLQAGVCLLGHGGVTCAKGGDQEGKLGDVGDRFKKILIQSVGGGDNGVGIIQT